MRVLVIVLLAWLTLGDAAIAQQKAGDGSLRLEYQYLRTAEFDSKTLGKLDIGHTDGHTVLLSMTYALNERWAITASLPWIKRRHTGPLPHNPNTEITAWTPPDLSVIDDGNYHSDFQDLYVGARYAAVQGPLTIEPFVAIGYPTNDYPFYAHAAVGRNIWHIPVGASFSYTPPISDAYYNWEVAYVFTEKSLGVNISHWLISGTAGYFITPRLAPKVWFVMKEGGGLNFPEDFDLTALNDEAWYFHDRTIKHNFINGGVGFDYIINDRYQLSGTVGKMLHSEQVNIVELQWSLGVTRFFSRGGY